MRCNFLYVVWVLALRIPRSWALDDHEGVHLWSPSTSNRHNVMALSAGQMQLRAEESCPPGAPCSCNCKCNPGKVPPPPLPPMPSPPVFQLPKKGLQDLRSATPPLPPPPIAHLVAPAAPKMPPLPGPGSYKGVPKILALKEPKAPEAPKDFGVPPKAPWETPAPARPHLIMPPPLTPAPPYTPPPRPTTTAEPTTTQVDPWWTRTTFPWWLHTTTQHQWTTTTAGATASVFPHSASFLQPAQQKHQPIKHTPAAMAALSNRGGFASSNYQSYVLQPGDTCACSSVCNAWKAK